MQFFSALNKKNKKPRLTVEQVQHEYPDIYNEIFKKGVISVHKNGVIADDLKKYPDGEKLAIKVKNGEMTIEEAAVAALKASNSKMKEEPNDKPVRTIGFHLNQ